MSPARKVWSSDGGRIEPRKKTGKHPAPPGDGIVRVARQTKGRKGKGVTLITGVPLRGDALKALAKELKTACGAGGAVKGPDIEIQGDHRDVLIPRLEALGWTVKRSGG